MPSNDPRRRVYVAEIVEYEVEADVRDGVYWTDVMLAITWATKELRERGELSGKEPASDQLMIVPSDDKIIVRLEHRWKEKKSGPQADYPRDV